MPDPKDEFDQALRDVDGALTEPDDFATHLAEAGVELPNAPAQAQAPKEASWLDILLAGADGASLGHGKLGQKIGDALAGARPEGAQVTGGGVVDQVPDTGSTRGARVAGTLATAIPATIAGGGSVAGQAIAGAALGGGQAHGDSGGDWLETLKGAAGGAALSGGLAGLGKAAAPLAGSGMIGGVPSTGTRAGQLADKLGEWVAPSGLKGMLIPEGARQLARSGAEKGLAAVGRAGPAAARGAALAGPVAGAAASKAQAQEVAYAGAPSTTWAVQSVLSSGRSGLPPEDERALTSAVMSGDKQKVITQTFLMQQKHPEYARRLEQELKSLQEDGGSQ